MIQHAETVEVLMTVYRVEAARIDVTEFQDKDTRYVLGYTTVYAYGAGREHSFRAGTGQRVCPGDTYTLTADSPREPGR